MGAGKSTFREAIQVQWFAQLFSRLEEMVGGQICQGRYDQIFYPYYKKDLAEGRITSEAAQELFQCLWLNMMQSVESQMSPAMASGREGFSHHETVSIGGQTPDGQDATNELSYIVLESTRPLKCSYPELAARIHARTPDRFLHAVAEAIKDGKGSPKLLNDEFQIPFLLSHGIEMREALDYAASGCTEGRLPNRETGKTGNSAINYGPVIEMTLRNGRVKSWNDPQFGLPTGDPRTFATYDDLWNAFRAQLLNCVKHIMVQVYTALALKPNYIAAPFCSMLHDLAMEHGRDLHTHSDYFPGALDASCIEGVGGFGTAIDSLAAINHLIYDTKKLTWDQLLDARNELGRQRSHPATLPERAEIRQRHRVGGRDRVRDPAHGHGVLPPVPEAARPDLQHAHHPDHLPRSLGQGHVRHAERPTGG